MIHGIALGGGALLGLGAAIVALHLLRPAARRGAVTGTQARTVTALTALTAILLWSTVVIGTYVSFPPYRAVPPEGTIDLSAYPKSLIQSNAETAWLHSFAMESKEHVPWIAAMLVTAVAFTALRDRRALFDDTRTHAMAAVLLVIAFALSSYMAILGTFVNKVAPLM